MKKKIHKGYQLLHDGVIALSHMEANGISVDVKYVRSQMRVMQLKIRKLSKLLKQTKIWAKWRKRFGAQAKLTSDDQLAVVLFEIMGIPVHKRTESGKPATDENSLAAIDLKFVRKWVALKKYQKARNTYLKGLLREQVDGFIHPNFNLHIPRTFRSSSDAPNFQNYPVRVEWMGALIRRSFRARPQKGVPRVLVEIDYSGAEVRVACCYNKDPMLRKYILDPSTDMHRDMARELFAIPDSAVVEKPVRHAAKNKFVFPQFYGSYYIECARGLWEEMVRRDLKGPEGVPLLEWLASKGITELGALDPSSPPVDGTFEAHVKEVEDGFWNDRFRVYSDWKSEWYASYLRKGYFDTYTGFRISGALSRNDVTNYPVQGSAFHCLLWSAIKLVDYVKRKRMGTLVCGQIHDSIVADVPVSELDHYLKAARFFMCRKIEEWAPWLNVPMDIEIEVSPIGGTWYDKKEITHTSEGWVCKSFNEGKSQHATAEELIREWSKSIHIQPN